MQLSKYKVAFLIYIIFWISYIAVHIIDFMYIYMLSVFIYEVIIGSFLLAFHYIFNILRYSIPYIFIYFLFYIFNIQYQGYYKFNFFGIDLQKHKSKINYLSFYFKEYNYFILLGFNLLFLLIILYFEIYRDILMIGIVLGFYIFLGINIYIKHLLLKKGYLNKVNFNILINVLCISIMSIYIDEIGDTIEQYVGWNKMDISEYLYGLLKKKDKFFIRLKNDKIESNYSWWRLLNLYKGQKASLQYIFLKNKIINKGILNDISTSNKYLLHTQTQNNSNISKLIDKINTDFTINNDKANNLFYLNDRQNNIYTDKNAVHYEYNKLNNQYKLLKNIRYGKYLENKNFKSYLLNMYGYTSAKFMPKTINYKKGITLTKLLKQDVNVKKLTNTFQKALLNEKAALKYNNYILSQYETKSKTYDVLIKEDSKSLNETNSFILKVKFLSSYLSVKLNYPSIDMQLYEFNNNLINWFKLNFKIYGYKYIYFLEYWEKKNYIMYKFFKDHNIKKYNILNRYQLKDKTYLIKLLKQEESNDTIDTNKIIHDKKFRVKFINSIDRNLLYADYYKTALSNKFQLLILELDKKNFNNLYIKNINKKFLLFKNPKIWNNFEYISNSNILKKIYLMWYPKEQWYFKYGIKNNDKTLIIFSDEFKSDKLIYIYKNKIDSTNLSYYFKYMRSTFIYNNLLTKYLHLKWIDYANMKDDEHSNLKQMLYVLYDMSYNNIESYESFKQWYNNKEWASATNFKTYIFNVANNLNDGSSKYYKQYLLETKDFVSSFYVKNKNIITYNDYLYTYKKFFYNYYKLQFHFQKWFIRTFKFQKNPYIFSTIKNPYLDRSVYWKEYLKAMDYTRYIESFSCQEERIVAEKLDMVLNRKIIAELALDARMALWYENLDEYLENKIDKLYLKRELESCGRVAEYLGIELGKVYTDYDFDVQEANMIYNHLREFNKTCLIELHKYLEDLQQIQRLFGHCSWEELEQAGVAEDPEIVQEITFVKTHEDLLIFSTDLKNQYQWNSIRLTLDLVQDVMKAKDLHNYRIEQILQYIVEEREADQLALKLEVKDKYQTLLDYAKGQNIVKNEFIKYQQENTFEKRFNRYLLNNDWDSYNKKRAKAEINIFKNFKKK